MLAALRKNEWMTWSAMRDRAEALQSTFSRFKNKPVRAGLLEVREGNPRHVRLIPLEQGRKTAAGPYNQ